jgi:hypothetical protein
MCLTLYFLSISSIRTFSGATMKATFDVGLVALGGMVRVPNDDVAEM